MTVTPLSQLSVPVAGSMATSTPQRSEGALTVLGAGQDGIGSVESITVTVVWHEAELPASSVAVRVTTVEPTGKKPSRSLDATWTVPSQLSSTVGSVSTAVPQRAGSE